MSFRSPVVASRAAAVVLLLLLAPAAVAQRPSDARLGPVGVSVRVAAGLAGVDADLGDALTAQGFADTYVPTLSGAPTEHPRTEGAGASWMLTASYAVRPPFDLAVTWAAETQLGAAAGFRAPGLFVGTAAHARTISATVGMDLGLVRLSAGPARYRVRYEVSGGGGADTFESRTGAVVDAAFGIPLAGNRVRSELFGQYRLVGEGVVGPGEVAAAVGEGTATFAATTVRLRHLVFGLGLRVRF